MKCPNNECEVIAKLKAEVAELKQGNCEHVKQDVIQPNCRLCELAIKEKRVEVLEAEVHDANMKVIDKCKEVAEIKESHYKNSRKYETHRRELLSENKKLKAKVTRLKTEIKRLKGEKVKSYNCPTGKKNREGG